MHDDPWYDPLLSELQAAADPERAAQMSAYMRDQFAFFGLPTATRRAVSEKYLKEQRKQKNLDWQFVDAFYALPQRECQYIAIEHIDSLANLLTTLDVPRLERMIITKSWWDTVDSIDRIVGDLALRHPELNELLLQWSLHDNIWLRRVAIDHQLNRKQHTDTRLFAEILKNNLNQKDFFINKAIGWSLREYSKTNRDWVAAFIDENRAALTPLSIREGSKYL